MTTNDTRTQLEEERRIINAATPGPHWISQGDENTAVYLGEGSGSDIMHAEFYSPDDAALYLHARTALPLRNAQVEAVLEAILTEEATAQRFAIQGHTVEAHAMKNSLAKIRRAIEEAGA